METLFRKFRSKQGEVWQLGFFEVPVWDPPAEGGRAYRPRMAACWSLRTGRLQLAGHEAGEPGSEVFREVILQAARAWKLRPERIEVADAWLAQDLAEFLAAEEVAVATREELPELSSGLEERARDFRKLLSTAPAALSGSGVTVEHVAGFARAAVRFAEAAPWHHLEPVDLLILAADGLPEELRCAQVLGPGMSGLHFSPEGRIEGAGEEQTLEDGLAWVDPATGEGIWTFSLRPPGLMPSEDVELWNRRDLPLADATAYPMVVRRRRAGEFERPEARLLAWFEAVLAALAATTEEELDTGRWHKEVVTAEGPLRLELTLPGLLDPSAVEQEAIEEGDEEPFTPEELAESLAEEAEGAPLRRQLQLARRAVALWPGCVNAWLTLARCAPDPATARDLYTEAFAASERLHPGAGPEGDRSLETEDGFDVLLYIFARLGLAKALWDLGAREEAVDHLRGILAVDPDDSEQVCYLLAHALLALGRTAEAEEVLDRYVDDRSDHHYARALLTFQREGDSSSARRHLAAALRSDRHADTQAMLLSSNVPDSARRRGHEPQDAVLFRDVWAEIPGALEWLRSHPTGVAPAGPARKKKRADKKRGDKKSRKKRRR